MWTLIALDGRGWLVAGLRQVAGFVLLSYLPGLLILRILRWQDLDGIQTLLYSVGLSLATVMLAGLLANLTFPSLGLARPLSVVPFLLLLTSIVLALCLVAYFRERKPAVQNRARGRASFSVSILLLSLPLLSVAGTLLQNTRHNSVLLMILIVMVALVSALASSSRIIPVQLHPFAIFAISLALLFHRSLISEYLAGFDIHEEYYYANLVRLNGVWDSAIPQGYNALLSVVVLAPVSSSVTGLDLDAVFKIFYPLWFSFVPVAMYRIFQKQTDERIGFLSVLFFVSFFQFYVDLPVMPRQMLAMLFLVALVMLRLDENLHGGGRFLLLLVFGASLVFSHYGLSYAYIVYLVLSGAVVRLSRDPAVEKLRAWVVRGLRILYRGDAPTLRAGSGLGAARYASVSPVFVAAFIVMAVAWYLYTANSWGFDTFVRHGYRIASNFLRAMFDPRYSHALSLLLASPKPGILGVVARVLDYLNPVFIVVGVLALLLKYERWRFEETFAAFAVINLGLLSAAVFVPFLTIAVNTERLYHVALIFLAPFGVLGGMVVLRKLLRSLGLWRADRGTDDVVRILWIYFVVYFLFQSGLVWQLTVGYSGSLSISQSGLAKFGKPQEKAALYTVITPKHEVLSAMWLSRVRESGQKVYATHRDIRVHALTSYGMVPVNDVMRLSRAIRMIPESAFVYLQYLNVVEGLGTEPSGSLLFGTEYSVYDFREINRLFVNKNKIYANGGSEIYR